MNKGTLKYLIILIVAVLFTAFLTYYISNATKIVKNNDKVIDKAIEIKKVDNEKEYILTRKMNVTKNDKEFQFNIKFYGETLSDNKKVITAEVYIGEKFTGEYVYINNVESDKKYEKIIDEYDESHDSRNILYVVDNMLVLELSKYDESRKATLVLYNDNLEIVDILNIDYINKCKTLTINNHEINNTTFENSSLYYYKLNNDGTIIEEYKINATINGFNTILTKSENYVNYCQ